MQRLQREGGVAHPGVAVVPVPLAARGLRQRGRQRRDGRAGGHVGEALDRRARSAGVGSRQRWSGIRARASQLRQNSTVASMRAPGVVGVGGCGEALGPGQRAEARARPRQHVARAARPPSMPSGMSVCSRSDCARRPRRRRHGRPRRPASSRPRSGRSRTPARRRARPRPWPSRHSTVRTSRWSASSSAGGLVCGVTVSGPGAAPRQRVADDEPAAAACARWSSGRWSRARRCAAVGTLMPNGPKPERARPRSRRLPKTLGESNAGRHSQSTEPSGRSARRYGSRTRTRSRRSAGTGRALPRCPPVVPWCRRIHARSVSASLVSGRHTSHVIPRPTVLPATLL